MEEPLWMDMADAVIAHDLELAAHGGSTGIRDAGLLESALARAKNIRAYAESTPSLVRLAAAYAFGTRCTDFTRDRGDYGNVASTAPLSEGENRQRKPPPDQLSGRRIPLKPEG